MKFKHYSIVLFLLSVQFSIAQWDYDKDNYWFEAGIGKFESTNSESTILDLSYNKISDDYIFRISYQKQNFGVLSDLLKIYFEKNSQVSFQVGIIDESRFAWIHGTIGLGINGISERKENALYQEPKHRTYLSIPFEVQLTYRTYGYFLNGFSIGGDYSPDRSHISFIFSAGIGDI